MHRRGVRIKGIAAGKVGLKSRSCDMHSWVHSLVFGLLCLTR